MGRVWEMLQEAADWQRRNTGETIQAVGVASMAESGLLLDNLRSGQERSVMLPWFDPLASAGRRNYWRTCFGVKERFLASGLRFSFKCSLAKILWLRQQNAAAPDGAVWLSAADYVAYRLSGAFGTDVSLGGRNWRIAYRKKNWRR